ncbi:hypothetical protein GYMLUDRAFT_251862 [Collybiopsis luxurians FD-317 M1]|uniref:Uncharacterized protein n=1 Tax=Collybiopsis luxurians FD-317 M1 TaxID=944289 RepID=A0A0D0CA09_9AGAR|nr:hypothetical protein GYMLUDRAFT_251862 [Collybiopsis luxurians FD-317 M1]
MLFHWSSALVLSLAMLPASWAVPAPSRDIYSRTIELESHSVARDMDALFRERGLSYPVATIDFALPEQLKKDIDAALGTGTSEWKDGTSEQEEQAKKDAKAFVEMIATTKVFKSSTLTLDDIKITTNKPQYRLGKFLAFLIKIRASPVCGEGRPCVAYIGSGYRSLRETDDGKLGKVIDISTK